MNQQQQGVPGFDRAPTEHEIRALTARSENLRYCVEDLYDKGICTWEQAMTSAAYLLVINRPVTPPTISWRRLSFLLIGLVAVFTTTAFMGHLTEYNLLFMAGVGAALCLVFAYALEKIP